MGGHWALRGAGCCNKEAGRKKKRNVVLAIELAPENVNDGVGHPNRDTHTCMPDTMMGMLSDVL